MKLFTTLVAGTFSDGSHPDQGTLATVISAGTSTQRNEAAAIANAALSVVGLPQYKVLEQQVYAETAPVLGTVLAPAGGIWAPQ